MSNSGSVEEEIKSIPLMSKRVKRLLVASIFAAIGLMIVMTTQSPSSGGPIAILAFLLMVFILLFSLVGIAIELLSRRIAMLKFSSVRFFYVCLIWAVGGILLIGLQTLRQLQLLDVALVLLFEVVLNFYILRRF